MVSTVWVNADHGRDFHPLAGDMTKLRIFTKEENRDLSAFRFSLTNLIVCLMISHKKTTYKSCTNELACCSGC